MTQNKRLPKGGSGSLAEVMVLITRDKDLFGFVSMDLKSLSIAIYLNTTLLNCSPNLLIFASVGLLITV